MISELFASAKSYYRIYEESSDDYNDYIIHCRFDIYGIPDDITEEEEEEILGGKKGKSVKVGKVTGLMILGHQALKQGLDVYDICDCVDEYAEFVYSALREDHGPLEMDSDLNIFCIDSIKMSRGYNTDALKLRILDSLPKFLFGIYNVYPDIIADYPKPLSYEKPAEEKIAEAEAREKAYEQVTDYMDSILNSDETGKSNAKKPRPCLNEAQQAYALNRRCKGESYPKSAIDEKVWDLYYEAGYEEHSTTRVLFKMIESED